MAIKTYRALIADGAQEEINLRTNDGKTGYQVTKFQVISNDPNSVAAECIMKIYKAKQSTLTDKINFSDNELLAVSYFSNSDNPAYTADQQIIFDTVIFNQNIFVTCHSALNTEPCNYYLELEQIKLNDNESTMATLQSIRSRYESYTPAGPT